MSFDFSNLTPDDLAALQAKVDALKAEQAAQAAPQPSAPVESSPSAADATVPSSVDTGTSPGTEPETPTGTGAGDGAATAGDGGAAAVSDTPPAAPSPSADDRARAQDLLGRLNLAATPGQVQTVLDWQAGA